MRWYTPRRRLAPGITVDPGAVIGPQAEIGADSVIGANAVIGPKVRIGARLLDRRRTAQSPMPLSATASSSIPAATSGRTASATSPACKGHVKVPQVGRVLIDNDVEIGAGTTIDRGGMRDTRIGEGSKIDNLCQIGHNVVLGRHCIVVALSGISGSVTIEDHVVLAGAVGVAPHLTIGKGAVLAARSGVMCDVPAGETWGGYPARPRTKWLRQQAMLARLTGRRAKPSGGT